MILIRDVFRLKFGKAKEARALWQEGMKLTRKYGYGPQRLLSDLTGPYYTLVMESEVESLAAWEANFGKTMGAADWEAWYHRFSPLVESGYREIFTIEPGS
jgi:hypothetical protein